jgi:hypothetical protein
MFMDVRKASLMRALARAAEREGKREKGPSAHDSQVPDLMVMDVWKASLMRALATRQLKAQPATAARFLEPGSQELDEFMRGAGPEGPEAGGLERPQGPDDPKRVPENQPLPIS